MNWRPIQDSVRYTMKPFPGFEIGYVIDYGPRFSIGCRVRRVGHERAYRRVFDSYEAACRATHAAGQLAIVHEPGGALSLTEPE